jgi:hypothetical protein
MHAAPGGKGGNVRTAAVFYCLALLLFAPAAGAECDSFAAQSKYFDALGQREPQSLENVKPDTPQYAEWFQAYRAAGCDPLDLDTDIKLATQDAENTATRRRAALFGDNRFCDRREALRWIEIERTMHTTDDTVRSVMTGKPLDRYTRHDLSYLKMLDIYLDHGCTQEQLDQDVR